MFASLKSWALRLSPRSSLGLSGFYWIIPLLAIALAIYFRPALSDRCKTTHGFAETRASGTPNRRRGPRAIAAAGAGGADCYHGRTLASRGVALFDDSTSMNYPEATGQAAGRKPAQVRANALPRCAAELSINSNNNCLAHIASNCTPFPTLYSWRKRFHIVAIHQLLRFEPRRIAATTANPARRLYRSRRRCDGRYGKTLGRKRSPASSHSSPMGRINAGGTLRRAARRQQNRRLRRTFPSRH